ncbi:uncharacterized protein LOC134837017 [Culicoides brevitarsis]|uniref:uncharacterized protein LOC134837017 n=1 Tax=Culicoides brevitarsis TaxID=469753 RepID=UPI00307C0673
MLRRLLKLTLIPRRNFPQIECRVFMEQNANPEKVLHTDDIVDELRAFTNAKLLATNLSIPSLKTIVPLFTELLECDETVAKEVARKHLKEIKTMTMKELRTQLETYIEAGFDRKLLLQHSEVLSMIPGIVREKLEILRAMPTGENGNGLNDYLPLMKLEVEDLKKFRDTLNRDKRMKMPFGDRLHFLSNNLDVEPYKISKLFLKYPYLKSLRRALIVKNTEVFLRYKVPKPKILKSGYTLQSNPSSKVQNRLENAKPIKGEDNLHAWLGYVDEKIYDNTLNYASENREPLKEVGAEDNIDYFRKRLGLNDTETEFFLMKYPRTKRMTVRVMKAHLDFLLDEAGYPAEKIAKVPYLFSYSVKTLRKRHEELKKLNHELESLYPLSRPSKEWDEYIQKLKNDKKY